MDNRHAFMGLNQWRREADHPLASSVDVKNVWMYTSILPYAFMACTGTTSNVTFVMNKNVTPTNAQYLLNMM
jgi:hypothetical protein